jgi:hypothetical protein
MLLCASLGAAVWLRMHTPQTVAVQPQPIPAIPQPTPRPIEKSPPVKPRPNVPPRVQKLPVDEKPSTEPVDPETPDDGVPEETAPPDSPVATEDRPPPQPKNPGLAVLPSFLVLPPVETQPSWQPLFRLPGGADFSYQLLGEPMIDGARLLLKPDSEPGRFSIFIDTASAVGGRERIARLDARGGALDFQWEPLKNAGQTKRWRELQNQVLRVDDGAAGQRMVPLRAPEHAAPLAINFAGKSESNWNLDLPPAGEYTAVLTAPEKLVLSSHGPQVSVRLRAAPAATPVELAVEVSPPKVFGKHMLQSRLHGSVRLTYRGVRIAREHLQADDPQALTPTAQPEPITPDAVRSYLGALARQINENAEKLKSLGPPPAPPRPPAGGPPAGPPPPDPQAERRQQLAQSIRRDREHQKQAQALDQLFAELQSTRFEFRVVCEVAGYPVSVVSTAAPGAPLANSSTGP